MAPSRALVFVVAAVLLADPAAATLLVNGGAEAGSLTGWQLTPSGAPASASTSRSQASGVVLPYEGSWFFTFADGPQAGTITLAQSGSNGLGGDFLVLNGRYQTEYGDPARATLSVLDGSGGVLASLTTGAMTTPNLSWRAFGELELAIPDGAAAWRVELQGSLSFGSYINVHWDALTLESVTTSVPAPSAPGLVLLGAVGLASGALRLRDLRRARPSR